MTLEDDALAIVAEVLERYGGLGNAQIKAVVYKTEPMRYLLSQERRGRDVRRIPVRRPLSLRLRKLPPLRSRGAPRIEGGSSQPAHRRPYAAAKELPPGRRRSDTRRRRGLLRL